MVSINKAENLRKLNTIWKRNRPKIEIIGGVIGTGVSMYLSNKSSTKLPKLMEETKNDMAKAKNKKERSQIRRRMIKALVKLYGFSGAMYLISVVGILDGMNVQNSRLIGVSTALALSVKELKEYRQITAEKIGVEAEQDLYNRVQIDTVETTVVNPKNGEEKKTKTTVKKFKDVGFNHGTFSFKFGKGYSDYYKNNDNPDYAINFLKGKEEHINEVVAQKDGSITTREILHRIGISDELILKQPGKPNNNKPFLHWLNNSGYMYDPEHPLTFGLTDDVIAALRRGEDVYLTLNIEPDIVTGVYQKICGGEDERDN